MLKTRSKHHFQGGVTEGSVFIFIFIFTADPRSGIQIPTPLADLGGNMLAAHVVVRFKQLKLDCNW